MKSSYMPAKQAQQVAWSNTFTTVVGSEPEAYGVPPATMTAFTAINTTLKNAWEAASEPSTRTKGTVAAKNNALKAMKTAARNIVSIIQGTPSVTDQMKIDAGVTVRKTHPTPKPAPTQKPFIKVTKVDGRNVTIELRQNSSKRGKPANVTAATIFTMTGETAPLVPEAWTFVESTGKTTVEIPFGPSATGDTVWITAFWMNDRKESGPAADPVSVNLPAGGVLPSEAETLTLKAA